jgi:hypothetical protein
MADLTNTYSKTFVITHHSAPTLDIPRFGDPFPEPGRRERAEAMLRDCVREAHERIARKWIKVNDTRYMRHVR